MFRLIRTNRKDDFCWQYAWSLMISTNGAISNFTPTKKEDPSLRKDENVVLLPPFIYNHSMDVLAIEFNSMALKRENTMNGVEYIYRWKRLGHILTCGRPLFYSFIEGNINDFLISATSENYDILHWPRAIQMSFLHSLG